MKLRNILLLLFIMAAIDQLIVLSVPVDFTYQSLSFIPHICLLTYLLLMQQQDWKDRVLVGAW